MTQFMPLMPYASHAQASRGRFKMEPASPTRSEFRRDCDRIIHSSAFRRLAYKTQVFVQNEGDHYRTRLTHSIEVSQIARALARGLGLDDDLAETLALAHDLGHTPFGHTGEDALSACLKDFGGFDHNAHALRIVTELEHRYATFNGLNLTWETLEGLVKHNGPLLDASGAPLSPHKTVAAAILEFDRQYPLDLSSHASLEAQCAALADDIAYNTHDIDDGLRAGLFSLDDLRQVPLLHELLEEIAQLHPGLSTARAIHELGRRVITRFVEDALTESKRRIARKAPQNVDEVRQAGETLIGFSTEFVAADKDIKGFLYPKMYRHERVMRIRAKAEHVLRQLFVLYMNSPEHLPAEWIKSEANEAELAAIVGDYIAGMTDRFALREYQRHFDLSYELG
eukprot:gene6562-6631_t